MAYAGDFHAYKIYAEQLFPLGHGHPLWEPEPTRFGEVQIGDVGYLRGGAFHRLFNAFRPGDDPLNVDFGCPGGEEYRPLRVNDYLWRHRSHAIPPGPLYSKCMKEMSADTQIASLGAGGGLSFQYTGGKGALLLLYDSATRSELHDSRLMQEYMHRHYDSWYKFATEDLDMVLDHTEIVFIQGWVKTTKWAVAAFAHGGRSGSLSFNANPALPASASLNISVSSEVSVSKQYRVGPIPDSPGGSHPLLTESGSTSQSRESGEPKADQCVFLQYCKLKRRLWRARVIKAAAEPKTFSDSQGGDEPDSRVLAGSNSEDSDDMEIESVPMRPQTHDPLDDLLDYILDNSDADVAIANHHDIAWLYESERLDASEDLPALLNKTCPAVTVNGYGLGTLRLNGGHEPQLPTSMLARDANEVWDDFLTDPTQFSKDDYAASLLDDSPMDDFLNTPETGSVDDLLTSPLIATVDENEFAHSWKTPFHDFGVGFAHTDHSKQPVKSGTATDALTTSTYSDLFTSSPAEINSDDTSAIVPHPGQSLRRTARSRTRVTPDALIPLDAPIQPRSYAAPSSTSENPVTNILNANRIAQYQATSDKSASGSSTAAPNSIDLDAIEAKRRQNTLAARRSRKRKMEYQQQLESDLERARADMEMWRSRALTLENELKERDLQQANAEVEAAREELAMWKSRAEALEVLLRDFRREIPPYQLAEAQQ
ncbi:hypothetical protein CERSUDRAFT_119761 [Gelatoporia subvermispora B]|uniref:BZIP domain-containing protein n=1 Tax=Ceriporiopsis subvermispora (strain B) TaxID=914234 RepID=M2P7R6_CERS8|nr:hypothetical protein CERSUDRAFT_119761 [Gelatoporia subvermispora B]